MYLIKFSMNFVNIIQVIEEQLCFVVSFRFTVLIFHVIKKKVNKKGFEYNEKEGLE